MRRRAPASPPPAIELVHEDADLLVVRKPAGLTTTAPDAATTCLASLVRAMRPKAPRMHPTSRLDRDVTGLVTFAKTDRAIAHLMDARTRGAYSRTYLALVPSAPTPPEGRWSSIIAIDPRDPTRRVTLAEGESGERAQEARTDYVLDAQALGCALLALFPQTGRTHQLRVHCAAAGLPILGDSTYGGSPRVVLDDGRVVSARRVMLHCAKLSLPALDRADALTLIDSPPADFRKLWLGLDGDAQALDARLT